MSKSFALILVVAIMLFVCCENGQNQEDVENSALVDISEVSNAESSTDTSSSEPSETIVVRIGNFFSTDDYIWKFTGAKIFDQNNYYGYFKHAPDHDSVYIALYFDMENVTDDYNSGILFHYNLLRYSQAHAYNNGYVLNYGCSTLDDSEYTSANPKFEPILPARAKVKGCFAWSIPKEWTDFEFIFVDHDTIKFQVSKGEISKTSEQV